MNRVEKVYHAYIKSLPYDQQLELMALISQNLVALRQEQGQPRPFEQEHLRQPLSASQAQRSADRSVFGDLVGCALSSGQPVWETEPQPHWQVPYRLFDGTLVKWVKVDAYTGNVSLTPQEREQLLQLVEQKMAPVNAPA
ncbi:MAG TPA: hypothetical protein PKE45_05755 [Caldilineaceae bacterium]|mgnify:FL=1|nr:hypothetical protein [Caldilineaceae bacterium]